MCMTECVNEIKRKLEPNTHQAFKTSSKSNIANIDQKVEGD